MMTSHQIGSSSNVACWSLFYSYYFGRCSCELAELVPLPHSWGSSTNYSNRLHDFLSPFLDVIRMSMSTVSFFAQLNSGILCPQNAFLWPYNLNGFKPRVNRHLFFFGPFYVATFALLFSSFSSLSCNSIPRSGCSALYGVKSH